MGELPQEETLLVESAEELASIPVRQSKLQRLAVVCGCAALVLAGYALGSRRSSLVGDSAIISESGAILTETDFETLYKKVVGKTGLTEAQLTTINVQITGGTPAPTDENVKMLKTWYAAGSSSNKIFANKLIVESMSSTTKTAPTPATVSAKCPITTYAEFGHLYSSETAGKTWAAINKIDSWVRGALPAVGAPLSVRKLRDCYKNTLSKAQQKHFTDSAVKPMKAGASR